MESKANDSPAPKSAAWRRALLLGAALVLGIAAAQTGLLEPTAGTLIPRCPTNAWFSLHCPACGGTRAVMRLLHGDLGGALRYNVAAILALPVVAYIFVAGSQIALRRWQVVALVLAILAYTLLRNLPSWPWILLAPPR